MKRIIFYLFCLLALKSAYLSAQEHKWEVSLSGVYGRVASETVINGLSTGKIVYKRELGHAIIPSIRYHFSPSWSAGVALLLPWTNERNLYAFCYTTGVELSFRYSLEVLPKLRLQLSALGMLGLTGPYKAIKNYQEFALPLGHPNYSKIKIDYQETRWQVGLRPSLNYDLAPNFRLELAYGFFGYRSNRDLKENYIFNNKKPKDAFGFNREMGWGNSFRVGFGYLF